MRFLYDYLPIEIQPGTYENDPIERMKMIKKIEVLMYSQSLSLDSPQVISHMFIHADTNHLTNNVINLIVAGYPVYKEFGIVGLTTIFFLGGVLSIVPISKSERDTAVENRVTLRHTRIADIVPKSIISWIDKPLQFVSKIVVDVAIEMYVNPIKMCGSSGGVCAIIACQSLIVARDACTLMLKVQNSMPLTRKEFWNLFLDLFGTVSTLPYFTSVNMVYRYDSALLSNNNTSLLYAINDNAHTQGF